MAVQSGLQLYPVTCLPSHMFLGYIESVSCESSKDKVSQVTSIQTCMNSPSTKMNDMEYTRTRRTGVCPFILYCTASQVFCRLSIEARYKVVQMNYVGDSITVCPALSEYMSDSTVYDYMKKMPVLPLSAGASRA